MLTAKQLRFENCTQYWMWILIPVTSMEVWFFTKLLDQKTKTNKPIKANKREKKTKKKPQKLTQQQKKPHNQRRDFWRTVPIY